MNKTVNVDCEKLAETDAAIQVAIEATGEIMWIPKSQIEDEDFGKDDKGSIEITKWIADKKGLT